MFEVYKTLNNTSPRFTYVQIKTFGSSDQKSIKIQ